MKLDMLKIYSDDDRSLLAKWTPARLELKQRLQKVGLAAKCSSIDPGLRLDFRGERKMQLSEIGL